MIYYHKVRYHCLGDSDKLFHILVLSSNRQGSHTKETEVVSPKHFLEKQ